MNLPNSITLVRLFFVPLVIFFIITPLPHHYFWALGIFILVAVTDVIDGFLARKLNEVTTTGKFLDPLVDKILVSSILITLVGVGDVHFLPVVIIVVREFFVTSLRLQRGEKSRIFEAGILGKVKTFTQMLAIMLFLGHRPLAEMVLWLAVFTSLVSAGEYWWRVRFKVQGPALSRAKGKDL